MRQKLFIVGASGHGKVLKSIAEELGYEVVSFVDDFSKKDRFQGCPVVSQIRLEPDLEFAVGIGNNLDRENSINKYLKLGFVPAKLIHPRAIVHRSVSIGAGSVVMAGVIVGPDSRIGQGCILNHGCTIDHDCTLADFVHVSPGVNIAGGVTVGHGSWFGIGSSAIQGVSIGDRVTIGASACVIRDVLNDQKVVGVPATPI